MIVVAQVVDDDGIAHTRHITAVTGRTTPQLSSVRKTLLDKGLLKAAGQGGFASPCRGSPSSCASGSTFRGTAPSSLQVLALSRSSHLRRDDWPGAVRVSCRRLANRPSKDPRAAADPVPVSARGPPTP